MPSFPQSLHGTEEDHEGSCCQPLITEHETQEEDQKKEEERGLDVAGHEKQSSPQGLAHPEQEVHVPNMGDIADVYEIADEYLDDDYPDASENESEKNITSYQRIAPVAE